MKNEHGNLTLGAVATIIVPCKIGHFFDEVQAGSRVILSLDYLTLSNYARNCSEKISLSSIR
jgi:hypothetical protein